MDDMVAALMLDFYGTVVTRMTLSSPRSARRWRRRSPCQFVTSEDAKSYRSGGLVIATLGRMSERRSLPEDVVLGIATPGDVPELLALWAVAAENDGRPGDTAQAVFALLERDPGACLVARQGDRIVGTLIAGWDGWRAHLYRLAVHPAMRRRGIAQALLDAGAARLRSLGATRLDAMVLEGNELGHALWQASGYIPQAEWRRWVKPVACAAEARLE
ncbi:MAG TPA: GNAT family N-acetyltransferase [Trebonia sp.]|nr:GNAT family N-acetyltransferase [Trebonia sp.]